MELQPVSEETMVEVAVAHLDARFPTVDRDEIDLTVRRVVRASFERARVTTFVGILAERQARAELEAELAKSA